MADGRLVSVVLPCFDAEPFLRPALESVLAQSWTRLEVVAVDDGSTDGTLSVLRDAAEADDRVRVLENGENRGLIDTLNRGVDAARGDFIARMDADDVAEPDRLARQVALLDARTDVGVVGSGALLIDARGRVVGARPVRAAAPPVLRFMALLATPLIHSSLLARAEVTRAHRYRLTDRSLHAEDYELFSRLLEAGVELANVDAPLLRVRIHGGSVSRTWESVQVDHFVALARDHLERTLDLHPEPRAHRVAVNRIPDDATPADLADGLRLLETIEERWTDRAHPDPSTRTAVRSVVRQQRFDVVVQAARRGSLALRTVALPRLAAAAVDLRDPRLRRYAASKLPRRGLSSSGDGAP